MSRNILHRPKLEEPEELSESSNFEADKINLSSNDVAIIQINNSKYQRSKLLGMTNNNTNRMLMSSAENELAETNNETNNASINRTPNLSNYPHYSFGISQSDRKQSKSTMGSQMSSGAKLKLSEYLQKSAKSKFKERKESPFLVNIKKELKFGENENKNKKERRDWNGTVINKKNKRKVQVTFQDWITDDPLVDVIYIESFKNFNYMRNMPKEDFIAKSRCECCTVF